MKYSLSAVLLCLILVSCSSAPQNLNGVSFENCIRTKSKYLVNSDEAKVLNDQFKKDFPKFINISPDLFFIGATYSCDIGADKSLVDFEAFSPNNGKNYSALILFDAEKNSLGLIQVECKEYDTTTAEIVETAGQKLLFRCFTSASGPGGSLDTVEYHLLDLSNFSSKLVWLKTTDYIDQSDKKTVVESVEEMEGIPDNFKKVIDRTSLEFPGFF